MPLLSGIPRADRLFFADVISSNSFLNLTQYTQVHSFQQLSGYSVSDPSFGFFVYLENGEINANSIVSQVTLEGSYITWEPDPFGNVISVETPILIHGYFGYTRANNNSKTFTIDLEVIDNWFLYPIGFMANGNFYNTLTINVQGQTVGKALVGIVFSRAVFFAFARDIETENPILVSGGLTGYINNPTLLKTVKVEKAVFNYITDFAVYGVYVFDMEYPFNDSDGDGYPDSLNINQLYQFVTNIGTVVAPPGGGSGTITLTDYNKIRRAVADEREYFIR